MPILGIIASSVLKVTNSYESIASSAPTSGSSVVFSSIPSSFKHLQIRITAFGSTAGCLLGFNGDTGSNATRHRLYGTGSSVIASAFTGIDTVQLSGASYTGDTTYPSVMIVDILDYASTNKNKTVRILEGTENNTNGEVGLFSGMWINTAAINRLDIISFSSFTSGSKIALYGIK